MYRRDTLVLLQHYLDRGFSNAAIAKQLGISRRLIYNLIKTGQLDRDLSAEATPQALGHLTRRLRTLAFPSLMVIDEIGFLPVSRPGLAALVPAPERPPL